MRLVQMVALILLAFSLWLLWPPVGSNAAAGSTANGNDSIAEQMAGVSEAGFKRAETVPTFTFPQDHGPHPGFRTEWWYLTGSLVTTTGRRFGVQWTLFRSQLHPQPTAGLSDQPWQSDAAYMLHVGISDVTGRQFYQTERFARGSGGLAGAVADPQPRAWMDSDHFTGQADGRWLLQGQAGSKGAAKDPTGKASFTLALQPQREPVLNGDRGLSQKGAGAGNASFYYSWPFMAATGTVTIAGEVHTVSGDLWLDREWSTSALDPDQAGWDWLALHLPDGRSLMTYRLRDHAQQAGPTSQGTISWPDGRHHHLTVEAFSMEPIDWWRSPQTGRRWPISWHVRVPADGGAIDQAIDLTVEATFPAQEHHGRFPYWEGLVVARDQTGEQAYGYLELVGYGR